jgi:hypothetical protein
MKGGDMTKDERLYARFDIAMDEHPKIMLLSDAAFRALHEATYYSRRQLTDGFLDERVALKKWRPEVIEELSSNHPERPSWVRVDGGWEIRDYAEHQTTTADIQAKKEAGRLGGLAKASKRLAPATDVPLAEGYQTSTSPLAITETETETETTTSNEVVKRTAVRGSRLSPDWLPSAESIAKAREDAPGVDHQAEHPVFVDYWISQPGQKGVKTNWDATWRNWMRRKQGDIKTTTAKRKPITKADQNAAEYQRIYGGGNERAGSIPAIDAGFST